MKKMGENKTLLIWKKKILKKYINKNQNRVGILLEKVCTQKRGIRTQKKKSIIYDGDIQGL
jgi:hypothetical protein